MGYILSGLWFFLTLKTEKSLTQSAIAKFHGSLNGEDDIESNLGNETEMFLLLESKTEQSDESDLDGDIDKL